MRVGLLGRVVAVAMVFATITSVAVSGAAQADEALPAIVQIDSGGAGGNGFLPDSYVTGGATDANHSGSNGLPNFSRTVANPIPQEQWNTFRFLESSYRIPDLTPGASYEVRLYFVDWFWTKVGQRVFDVAVNDTVVLDDFDIIRAAVTAGGDGRYLGVEKDVTVTAGSDGTIGIDLIRGSVDQPMINAIAVVPVG